MASLFWVGGTGSYDGVTNHFATSSGGAASVALVTSADDVTFDSASGSGTVTIAATWSSNTLVMNATGLTVTTDGASTITTAGAVTLTNGTLNTNGSACNWNSFALGAGTKTLTLGASVITIPGNTGTPWNASTNGANFTINANSSTITLNANASVIFAGNGKTYNDASFTGSGSLTITGANTFNNLTRSSTVSGSQGLVLPSSTTINGTFTCTGTYTAANGVRIYVTPSQPTAFTTTPATITAGSVLLTNVDFNFVNAQGGTLPWRGTSVGDAGGNTNITFDTPRNLYWVGSATAWSTLNRWALSSGGFPANTVPLPQDNCFIDANSRVAANGSFSASLRCMGRNIDFTGVPNKPVFAFGNFNPQITGNLTWGAGMKITNTAGAANLTITGENRALTLTNNGVVWGFKFGFNYGGTPGVGSLTLADDLVMDSGAQVSIISATFNANNKNFTVGGFGSAANNTRIINMGSGTWTLSGYSTAAVTNYTVWDMGAGANITINPSTSTILITDNDGSGKRFFAMGLTYADIQISPFGTGDVQMIGGGSFRNVTITGPKTVKWEAGKTWSCVNFTANGDASNLIYFRSSINGYPWKLNVSSGYSTSFIDLQDSDASGTLL